MEEDHESNWVPTYEKEKGSAGIVCQGGDGVGDGGDNGEEGNSANASGDSEEADGIASVGESEEDEEIGAEQHKDGDDCDAHAEATAIDLDSAGSSANEQGDEPELNAAIIEGYAATVIGDDPCTPSCVGDKFERVVQCVASISPMTKQERKASVLAVLAILVETAKSTKQRVRFAYALPLVGKCCRAVFCACYQLSSASLDRLRAQVSQGSFTPRIHKGLKNKNTATIDPTWLTTWFRAFAENVGQVVPVRIRRQQRGGGSATSRVSTERFTLLLPFFAWKRLHREMTIYADDERAKQRAVGETETQVHQNKIKRAVQSKAGESEECKEVDKSGRRTEDETKEEAVSDSRPARRSSKKGSGFRILPDESTMWKHLMKDCSDIKIKSPRSNVCDVCFIYVSALSKRPSADDTERFGAHTGGEANEFCTSVADENHVVLTMDYAQNLALPSAAETPSEWYFLSLISISMFGTHDENQKKQINFLYSERKGKKGPNEVISMLDHYVDTRELSSRTLSVFADNCGGQNKNNIVLKYLVALARTGLFKEINYSFLIKGHTKNSCDCGFGVIRRKIAKSTLYTMRQLHDAVKEASVSSESVLLEEESTSFRDFKESLDELYRNVKGIQKYQLFQVRHDLPGSIICRAVPNAEPDVFDLRCKYDDTAVTAERALRLLDEATPLPDPPMNSEKVCDIYKKVAKYVPREHRGDPLYQPPIAEQEEQSRATKKLRVSARPSLPKRNSDPK